MTNLPSGTVTFLFTDIEGSTKLAQGHPDKWKDLRARHHAILQSAMDAHNGYVFQIIGASWTQRDVDEWPLTEFERPDYDACINAILAALGDDAFDRAFEKGKAMTLEQALELALS